MPDLKTMFPAGANILYNSVSRMEWIPGVVHGHDATGRRVVLCRFPSSVEPLKVVAVTDAVSSTTNQKPPFDNDKTT